MKVLLVDDDSLQTEWLRGELVRKFPTAGLDEINTEFGFREQLTQIQSAPPDLILLDVMLRWTDVAEVTVPMPKDVAEGKYFKAGLRCLGLLLQHHVTKIIPVVLLTVLDEADLAPELEKLPPNVIHVSKTTDPDFLFRKIDEVINRK